MKNTQPDQLTKTAHWVNAIAVAVLIVTGFMIMGDSDDGPSALLGVDLRQLGLAWHFPFAVVLTTVGFLYALSLAVTGRWRMFALSGETVKSASAAVRDALAGKPPALETGAYNGAQVLAYAAVLLMALGEVISGFALFFSHRFPGFIATLGGHEAVRDVHEALMFGILLFAVVHIVQVLRAGTPVIAPMLLRPFNALAPKEAFGRRAIATATTASVAAIAIAFIGAQVRGPLRAVPAATTEQIAAREQIGDHETVGKIEPEAEGSRQGPGVRSQGPQRPISEERTSEEDRD